MEDVITFFTVVSWIAFISAVVWLVVWLKDKFKKISLIERYAKKLIDFVNKDYSPTKVLSKSDKAITITSNDDFNDIGRVFSFSVDPDTKKVNICCTKYPGGRWMQNPTEYNFHLNYNQGVCHDYVKDEKKVISQIKQKMVFHPVASYYAPLEDF